LSAGKMRGKKVIHKPWRDRGNYTNIPVFFDLDGIRQQRPVWKKAACLPS